MYAIEKFLILLASMCLIPMNVNGKTILDTNFGNATKEINQRNEQINNEIYGKLPENWTDNSNWASIQAEYIPSEENGLKFLRIKIKKVISGWCQLIYEKPLPKFDENKYYKLSIKLRNPTRVTIAIGIRTIIEPYEFLAIERGSFSKNWEVYTFDYKMKSTDNPTGLYLAVIGEGFCDIAYVNLQEFTKDEIIENTRKNYEKYNRKNLLRTTTFPLGLQSGWSLDRDNSDHDDVIIFTDEKIGISGVPTLKIVSNEEMKLWLTVFKVEDISYPHTASIYMQGIWKGRLIVACDKKHLASQEIAMEMSNGWQRITVTFFPEITGKSYAIRLDGKGIIWIDAMQVEIGEQATEYKSEYPCEVLLACPKGDASIALIQFEDEIPIIKYCVIGKTENSKLKIKIINTYGDVKYLNDISIRNEFLNYGEFSYDVFPDKPFGSFRVEAHVENNKGERISTYNEIIIHRIRRPHYWMKDAPNSPFGIHTNSTTRHIIMAKAVGINWNRLHDAGSEYLMWYFVEPERDQWRFRDKEIFRYRKYGMKILAELGTAPKWASYFQNVGKDYNDYFDKFYQPKDLNDYAKYVSVISKRYKGIIDAYDVWNEPWNHAWWAVGYDEQKKTQHGGYITSDNPMKDFTNLMATAYKELKKVDNNNIILGFNTTTSTAGSGNFGGDEWTQGILENSGLNYCDIICYHDYTIEDLGFLNDASEKGFNIAFGPIIKSLDYIPKPIWMTEGLSTMLKTGAGFYNHTIPYKSLENVIDISDTICRYVISHLSLNVQKVFLYSMHCHSYFPNEEMVQFRPLVTEEGFLHPSGTAFSNMAWHLEDTKFVSLITLSEGVYAYIFKGNNRSIAVLSTKIYHDKYIINSKGKAQLRDLFGNPLPDGFELKDTLVYVTFEGNINELIDILK